MFSESGNRTELVDNLAGALGLVYGNNLESYIKILNLLANGKPVSVNDIAQSLGRHRLLVNAYFSFLVSDKNIQRNDKGNIIGMGITLNPTKHALFIRGNHVYTWCAVDTLLFPIMLKESARVETCCPVTHTKISFNISPAGGITELSPESAVISFVIPTPTQAKEDIRQSFCQFANLFENLAAAQAWQRTHPNALNFSAKDGFQFATDVVAKLRANSTPAQGTLFSLFSKKTAQRMGCSVAMGLITSLAAYLLMKTEFISNNPSTFNLMSSFLLGSFSGYALSRRFLADAEPVDAPRPKVH